MLSLPVLHDFYTGFARHLAFFVVDQNDTRYQN